MTGLTIELVFPQTVLRVAPVKGRGQSLQETYANQLECIRTHADTLGISSSLVAELEKLLDLPAVAGDHGRVCLQESARYHSPDSCTQHRKEHSA